MVNQSNEQSSGWTMPPWLRIILSILRFLLIPALCVVALFVGLTIGYATIGGGDASAVFHIETWKHLYDLVFS